VFVHDPRPFIGLADGIKLLAIQVEPGGVQVFEGFITFTKPGVGDGGGVMGVGETAFIVFDEPIAVFNRCV
jgi:hypothetical protein